MDLASDISGDIDMTSATNLAFYGLLAAFVSAGVIGISDGRAQTVDKVAAAPDREAEVEFIDRGKMRLKLLMSLVGNELQAAANEKGQLDQERLQLTRERAELSAIGDRRRPSDEVRLEQIETRLGAIEEEMSAVEGRLPEINSELDGLQRRLDEANGIVRRAAVDSSLVGVAEDNGSAADDQSSASIWLDGKRQIQEALVYLGGYNALIDGDFGPRTAQAIKVYQARANVEETGVLSDEQQAALLDEARAQRALYGVEVVDDIEFGYRISYPTLLLSETKRVSPDQRRMTTGDGECELLITIIDDGEDIDALYEESADQYEVQYRRKRDDWFVVAGLLGEDRIIYDTVRRTDDHLVRARLSYPAEKRELWSPFAVIMFNTFSTSPAG
jgi:hypothetical protein